MSYVKVFGNYENEPSEIQGFKVVDENSHFDFAVDFDTNENTTYYLVVVSYVTGNSFRSSGGNLDFVMLYQTESKAIECQDAIINHDKENGTYSRKGKYSLKIKTESGKEMTISPYWHGYFESLEFVEIVPIKMNGTRTRRIYKQ